VRAELLRQAEQMMIEDYPLTTLFFLVAKALVNPQVTGWIENVNDTHRSRWICFSNAEERRAANR